MRHQRLLRVIFASGAALVLAVAIPGAFAQGGDTLVSAGSASLTLPFSQNKQNEPAVAIDANPANAGWVVAGANDNIDMEACNAGPDNNCPFTPGVGVSGVYFSHDGGHTWTQPTYTGWSARNCLGTAGIDTDTCQPVVGPIGTLPWYYENGLVSDGDPAVAFGPKPGPDGFKWSNGSRLYYANLTSNFGATRSESVFRGFEALAVSRTDDVPAAAAGSKAAWMPPVIVTRQASTTFMDKEQIWADNASSSKYFGTVYVCSVAFRSNSHGNNAPAPVIVATSHDGGDTWTQKQLTPAQSPSHAGWSGCTVRTTSYGRAFVFFTEFAPGFPGHGYHVMSYSDNGGQTWTRPVRVLPATDLCNGFDPVIGRCVEDGVAGARDDLGPAPSIDIANGAPTGAGATNLIVDAWADGSAGLNNEQVLFSSSTTGMPGSWSTPVPIQSPGDRGYYAAPAISPDGSDVYVTYNAFLTPWQSDTSSPRVLEGVMLHANAGGGTVGAFTEVHRGDPGDPRASSQNNLAAEFLGDYVYTAATNDYAVGVWNDTRRGADCPAIDQWRFALRGGVGDPLPAGASRDQEGDEDTGPVEQAADDPAPAPQVACPVNFGNSDIFGASIADPTP